MFVTLRPPPGAPAPLPAPARMTDVERLSVVVVHHRTPDILATCLARLARAAPEAQVLVVDTGADDGAWERLRAAHPRVEAIRTVNHSYAHAVNVGLQRARGRFVAHMNADVYVEPDTFERLLATFARYPETGVAAPLARTPSGRRQDHGPLYHRHYLRLDRHPGSSVAVPWLTGCVQLVSRAALDRCGGLDPSLRFYNEDRDFCLRVRRAGLACRLVDTPVLHLGGRSTPAEGAFLVEGVRGGYQLSRRYLPVPARALHRFGLLLWATAAAATARRPERRRAYATIASMAIRGTFDESPFGATLEHVR